MMLLDPPRQYLSLPDTRINAPSRMVNPTGNPTAYGENRSGATGTRSGKVGPTQLRSPQMVEPGLSFVEG